MKIKTFVSLAGLLALAGAIPLRAEVSPATAPSPAPEKKPTELQERFAETVEQFVREQSRQAKGAFVVHDDELDKNWRLTLVRIHKDRIVPLGGERFFACADFLEAKAPKKGVAKSALDLDFYVKNTPSGWLVEEVLVHKVNGQPRYTYDRYNQRVPVTN